MTDAADTPLVRRGWAFNGWSAGMQTVWRDEQPYNDGGPEMSPVLVIRLTPEGEWPEALVERVTDAIAALEDLSESSSDLARAALRAMGETT